MTSDELRHLAGDPAAFRSALVIEAADGRLVRLGECQADFQREVFSAMDPAWRRLADRRASEPRYRRAWVERCRGGSKSQDAAVMALWLLFASRRALRGVVVAVDQDQASVVRQAVERLARLNPWLGSLLTIGRWSIRNDRTGSVLEILASDTASSYGLLLDFAILDEVSMWRDDLMWTSLLSAVGKRPDSVLVCLLNAGWRDSWAYGVREAVRGDGAWLFRSDGVAPWISGGQLAEQRRLLPAVAYHRLWEGCWVEGSGGDPAFSAGELSGLVSLSGPARPSRGWAHVIGLDVGVRKNWTAAVVLAKHVGRVDEVEEDRPEPTRIQRILREVGWLEESEPARRTVVTEGSGELRLGPVAVWKPRGGEVDVEAVAGWLERTAREYRARVVSDPWESRGLVQRLRRAGVRAETVSMTAGTLQDQAAELLAVVRSGQLKLWRCEELLTDMRRAEVEERAAGFRLRSPVAADGSHGDVLSALSIAVAGARRCRPWRERRLLVG